MLIKKAFRYRLEPSKAQRQVFGRFAGTCRFVFNQALEARKVTFENEGRTLSYVDQCKALTEMKNSEPMAWLKEVHSQVLQQELKDLNAAYMHAFRRLRLGGKPGFPHFKKKGQKDSFRYPQGIKVEGSRVYLPKIGWVKFRNSRPIEGRILQATVKREGDNWFVSFACEVEISEPARVPISAKKSIGIDVGLKNFAVLSDGTVIQNPRFFQSTLVALSRAQRALSRKQKYSNNWIKQIRKISGLRRRAKDCRMDFCHKLSSAIVKNHDVIAVEDLYILGLVKNRHLSRAISDAGWGRFLRMLEYKAKWSGKHFVRVGRFLPTSRVCSSCGREQSMPLSVRTFTCTGCGMARDRDFNASLNIRAAGLAVLNACGGA